MGIFIYILTMGGIPHYIGKSKNPIKRGNKHRNKYPLSILEIIDEVPQEEWRFWERHYISLYRSWGFNLDNKKLYAGNGADIVSEKTKNKLSIAQTGKKLSLKTRNKISNRLKGIKLSMGTVEKMSGKNNHNSKPVLQINRETNKIIKEWEALILASNNLGIKKQGISMACRGVIKSSGGFIWKFKINK